MEGSRHPDGTLIDPFILAGLPYPVYVIGPDERIFYVNEAAEQYLNQPRRVLLGRNLAQEFFADADLGPAIVEARRSGRTIRMAGNPATANLYDEASLVPWDGNVTILLRVRGAVERAAADREPVNQVHALSNMAAYLAHEIKNPLAGIRGAAQLLQGSVPARDTRLSQLIIDETDRIKRLVERLEILSDQGPATRAALNLHEILDDAIRLAGAGFAQAHVIERHYDPSLPPIWAHPDLLHQIFLNLLKNAAEATSPPDGKIMVVTSFRHGPQAPLLKGAGVSLPPICVSIQDNGPGPGRKPAEIFRPLLSAKPGGRGLGLALVAKLATELDGNVAFRREGGKTCFDVFLPVADDR